jgi:hypothetical protein
MKGKKANIEFVSQFMSECVKRGISTPEAIVSEAKIQLEELERKIKEAENWKIARSDILDVVESFEKGGKKIPDGAENLDLFQIEQPEICRFICGIVKMEPIMMSSLNSTHYDVQDMIFCVKQLVQFGVLNKSGDVLLRGDRFGDYLAIMELGAQK